jgi:hypothetical protein
MQQIQIPKETDTNKDNNNTKSTSEFDRLLQQPVNINRKPIKRWDKYIVPVIVLTMGALCMIPVWNINLWQPPRKISPDGGLGGSVPVDSGPDIIIDSGSRG